MWYINKISDTFVNMHIDRTSDSYIFRVQTEPNSPYIIAKTILSDNEEEHLRIVSEIDIPEVFLANFHLAKAIGTKDTNNSIMQALHDAYDVTENVILLMEEAQGISLHNFSLKSPSRPIEYKEWLGMKGAFFYILHKSGIDHNDMLADMSSIMTPNILVNYTAADDRYILSLIDWGNSKKIPPSDLASNISSNRKKFKAFEEELIDSGHLCPLESEPDPDLVPSNDPEFHEIFLPILLQDSPSR